MNKKFSFWGLFQLICWIISISSGFIALLTLFYISADRAVFYSRRDEYFGALFIFVVFNPKCWKFAKDLIYKS
ncbi:hypothetical protein IO46_05875 [Gallibacterium anatis]|uniref:hypothetical protein n=1 Tax=Gallibacterium anatis TaxID=750 RepID=UPI000531FAD2|nr:hypothetical protein [Gallibacterium anatis]KGQ52554.1 hypothetical protein IO46_05875 [Gallibacterium anatis]